MTTPQHENPCLGGYDIYNSSIPFFCYYYHILGRLDLEYQWRIYQFYTFHLKIMSPCGGRVMTILFPLQVLHTNLVQTDPAVLEKKTLPDDAKERRWSPADRNKVHMCNSNDPKIIKSSCSLLMTTLFKKHVTSCLFRIIQLFELQKILSLFIGQESHHDQLYFSDNGSQI